MLEAHFLFKEDEESLRKILKLLGLTLSGREGHWRIISKQGKTDAVAFSDADLPFVLMDQNSNVVNKSGDYDGAKKFLQKCLANSYVAESRTGLDFTVKNGLGLNNPVIKLDNGDEIVVTGMSYKDTGKNRKNLRTTSEMTDHYTEDFELSGVGGKKYLVTREVTIFDPKAKVKGGRFKSEIVSVSLAEGIKIKCSVNSVVNNILSGTPVREALLNEVSRDKYLSTDDIKTSSIVRNFFVDSSLIDDFYNFMSKWNKDSEAYYKKRYENLEYEPLQFSVGKVYIKVIRKNTVDAFIDKFGNVYKPAGWNAPAKGVRYYLSDYNRIPFDPYGSFLYGNRNLVPNTADSFNIEKSLEESMGMFGEDDSFFTKEELMEFASDVVDEVNGYYKSVNSPFSVDYTGAWVEDDDRTITVDFVCFPNETDYSISVKVDMRAIKSPNDLFKYVPKMAEELKKQISAEEVVESKSIIESTSDIKEAFAVYTGGNIWLFYGKLKDGNWFLTDDYGSTLILDADPSDLDESTYMEWQDEHKIKELSGKELEKFDDALLDKLLSYPSNDYKHTGGISNSEIDAYRKYFKSI